MADAQQEPGMLAAMVKAIRGWMGNADQSVEGRAAAAKPVDQAAAAMLPDAVMPHAGLAEDARRKAMIDAALRGER